MVYLPSQTVVTMSERAQSSPWDISCTQKWEHFKDEGSGYCVCRSDSNRSSLRKPTQQNALSKEKPLSWVSKMEELALETPKHSRCRARAGTTQQAGLCSQLWGQGLWEDFRAAG